ncbi:MAG TPA: septum formation initiator family protein [Alphaproteobacteria bacterium]|jgi:cell division protein FtsB
MSLLGELRVRARHIVGPVLAASLFAYFAYHAVQGDRGLIAWLKLSQQVDEARIEAARLAETRAGLAHRVRLMSPESLDPDLLEERARAVLGYIRADEVVIAPGVGAGSEAEPDASLLRSGAAAGPGDSARALPRQSFPISLRR